MALHYHWYMCECAMLSFDIREKVRTSPLSLSPDRSPHRPCLIFRKGTKAEHGALPQEVAPTYCFSGLITYPDRCFLSSCRRVSGSIEETRCVQACVEGVGSLSSDAPGGMVDAVEEDPSSSQKVSRTCE